MFEGGMVSITVLNYRFVALGFVDLLLKGQADPDEPLLKVLL